MLSALSSPAWSSVLCLGVLLLGHPRHVSPCLSPENISRQPRWRGSALLPEGLDAMLFTMPPPGVVLSTPGIALGPKDAPVSYTSVGP